MLPEKKLAVQAIREDGQVDNIWLVVDHSAKELSQAQVVATALPFLKEDGYVSAIAISDPDSCEMQPIMIHLPVGILEIKEAETEF